jgi:flavin-dependent dehydrogenase
MLANEALMLPEVCGRPLARFWSAWGSDDLELSSSHFRRLTDSIALNRYELDQWYVDQALKVGVIVHLDSCAFQVRRIENDWCVKIQNCGSRENIQGRFIVEATGRFARSLCQPTVRRLYTDQLVCVSTTVLSSVSGELEAFVEAGEIGWWYVLKDEERLFLAFFTDSDQIPARAYRRAWFEKEFSRTRHVRQLVTTIASCNELCVRDARTSIRSTLWRENWLAVGDASWTLDPLSGTGYERAVQSGLAAGLAISESFHTRSDTPLRDFAIQQVNGFRSSIEMQRRVYFNENRFDSHFWKRRHNDMI